jgi:hypothetical protein
MELPHPRAPTLPPWHRVLSSLPPPRSWFLRAHLPPPKHLPLPHSLPTRSRNPLVSHPLSRSALRPPSTLPSSLSSLTDRSTNPRTPLAALAPFSLPLLRQPKTPSPLKDSSADHRTSPTAIAPFRSPRPRPQPRPHALRPTAPNSLTTTSLPDVVPTTKAASASHGFPKNVARPAHKAYSDSSLLHGKSTSESLRGGVGGDFEEVSKAELDDEFDVLDNEGPSAANGAIKEDGSLSAGWEDDE